MATQARQLSAPGGAPAASGAPGGGGGGDGAAAGKKKAAAEEAAKAGEEAKKPTDDLKKMLGMSAYEVMEAERKRNPRCSVTRLVYCANLEDGASQDAAIRAHAQIWSKLKEEEATSVYEGNPDMEVTGLLLVHAKCAVHVYETKCQNALDFVTRLRDCKLIKQDQCRVLFNSEDCPDRYFKDWKAFKVSSKRDDFEIEDNQDPCDYSWDVYTALLKINETMTKRNEHDITKSASYDSVPSHEKLSAMAKCDKWFKLEEYCQFYCDPVYVELDSEKVWPVQKFEKITGYLDE